MPPANATGLLPCSRPVAPTQEAAILELVLLDWEPVQLERALPATITGPNYLTASFPSLSSFTGSTEVPNIDFAAVSPALTVKEPMVHLESSE